MSDKSRRRKARNSGDSEKLSEDSFEDNEPIKGSEEETDLNASNEGTRESEYETVEDDTETDDSTAVDEDDDDSVIIEYEREEGDGQESVPPKEKKLDDDEDRRNPQYIPKRGTFYEHDDRTATEDVSGEESNEKEATDRAAKEGQGTGDAKSKKVWREHENRWNHDRYNEDEQAPKSREELIAIYGYDIRNEEGPPRARRRRRYGRGPNKYTRNWEDEDAYGKPQLPVPSTRGTRRGGRRGGSNNMRRSDQDQEEEFPPLVNNRQEINDTSNSTVNQNVSVQGSTYSSRTMGYKKYNKEDRSSNRKPQQDAFPPLDSESYLTQNSASHESSTRNQINSDNNSMNNKDEIRILNSSSGRRIHGPADSGTRGGRGRGRSRGRGGFISASGNNNNNISVVGSDIIQGVSTKSRGRTRSSSETRLVTESSHKQESVIETSVILSNQQQQSGYHMTNRNFQDEAPREYHRRSNKSGNPQPFHQSQQPSPPQQQQQQQATIPGSDRRQQVVVPPRLQQQHQQDNSGSNRPKRYSSLRQRSLPESGTAYSQPPPTTAYYQAAELETSDNGTNRPKRYSTIRPVSGAVYTQPDVASTYYQPTGYVTPQPVYGDTPQNPQTAGGTPPLQLLPPHAHAPTPAYAAPFPSPTTAFVGPPPRMLPPGAGAPTAYIPAPNPGTAILNYVAPPPTFTAFQGFPAVPTAGPPPTELYQPQGITYYNTEEQNIVPRPITQKRQRSAIPIVPPPECTSVPPVSKGRGRAIREVSPAEVGGSGDAQPPPPSDEPLSSTKFEDAPTSSSTTPSVTKVA